MICEIFNEKSIFGIEMNLMEKMRLWKEKRKTKVEDLMFEIGIERER
jgi:hypothetical protein